LVPPNHSYWRTLPAEKLYAGALLSYFLYREMPFRNFYARVFVMAAWWNRLTSNYIPHYLLYGDTKMIVAYDKWRLKDVRCYD